MKKETNRSAKILSSFILHASSYLIVWFIPSLLAAQEKQPAKKDPPPQIVVALPLSVELSKTTKLVVRGIGLEAVKEVRLHEPRSSGKILGKGKKVPVPNQIPATRVGDSEIEIEITTPKEVAGGVVPFTLIGPTGSESKPHSIIVCDESPRLAEKEPNDSFKAAQALTMPVVVEGSIRQNQDVDIFKFEAKAGDKLRCELQAARFGSPVDGILTLFNDAGQILQTVGESSASSDPVLTLNVPKTGTYYLSLIDAHDQGGNIYLYRLICRIDGQ
jgi:hypothetical protein